MTTKQFRLIVLMGLWLALASVIYAQPAASASVEELSNALLTAKSEQEQAALLERHKEMLTAQLFKRLEAAANALYQKSDFPAALAAFQLARHVAERLGDPQAMIAALNGFGTTHLARGQYQPGLEALEQTWKLAESGNDKPLLANLQNKLCVARFRLGNFEQAAEHCQRALTLAEALSNQRLAAMTLNNLGNIANRRGDYEAALEFYRRSLLMREALGDKPGMASALNNQGVVYQGTGDLTAALEHYLRSLKLAEETGDKSMIALALNNAGLIYRERGNHQLALEYGQRSLALSEAIGDNSVIHEAQEALGRIHRELGDRAQAMEWFRKSLALAETTGEKSAIIKRLVNIGGAAAWVDNNPKQAIEYLQRGLALAESIGEPYHMIAGLCSLSLIHLEQGRAAEALEWAERSVTQARQLGAHKEYWESLAGVGAALRALKQPERARQRFADAINAIESARSQLLAGEDEQAGFFRYFSDPYQQMATLLAEQGQFAEAFEFAERIKARALLDVLQRGKSGIHKAMSAAERQQERRLRDEMIALNTQLRGAAASAPARVGELKAKVQKARLAYEEFQSQLYLAHPELKIQRGEAQPIKAADAAALLSHRDTALLEYVVTDEATWLFTLTQEPSGVAMKAFPLAVKRDELAKLTNAFRQQLASLDLKFRPAARQLYDLLLKPAQSLLANQTQLIIVPDGKLWELPFQALITPKNQYLIETAAVSYAPSLTVLREMQSARKRRTNNSGELLALGNPSFGQETIKRMELAYRDAKLVPLPEAEAEVKALGKLYGATSRVYVSGEAREDRLKAEAAQAGVLHIATHGVLNDAAPMYSHLALASNDEKEDGLLEAWELMQMDLKADLAVLSACETARGRIGAGEGVIGLSWALFVAGVPSTVVSQWKVESSSTRDLMLGFHRGLRNKTRPLTKAEALRQAVLPLLKNARTDHPFYWAGNEKKYNNLSRLLLSL